MKSWTTQAEQRLTEYLTERASREGLQGEEAEDLKADLRVHIHEEAERSNSESIGLMLLENILGKLDSGYRPAPDTGTPAVRKRGKLVLSLFWTFGVVLPFLVLGFESISSFCGSVFFDPVPTWWHFLLIATVPLTNGWLLNGKNGSSERLKGIAAGFALVVACFYGLLFLPLLPPSVIALVFGIGLLSLTPILAVWITWLINRSAKKQSPDIRSFVIGKRTGVCAALLILLALEGPALWTRANLSATTKDDSETREAAISRLRAFHSERVLLKACYEGNRGTSMATDPSGWMLMSWQIPYAMITRNFDIRPSDSENNREVFFRVTGKPFNSLKPPTKSNGGALIGRADPMEDFEFDDHLGGDDVAIRLKHLDLTDSRFDGHVDSVSGIGYGEWTMVFHNGSNQAKEARCQVRLPRDGTVSRLTLWVNGEPREAAFSTVSKVKAAYKSVAVVQRRDPVLVNVVGPDTVMVQCFPVPARGDMKIRLGISAPLDERRMEMPRIVERNFGLKSGLGHALWLQGDLPFHLTGSGDAKKSHADGDGQSLPLTLKGDAVTEPNLAVQMGPSESPSPLVWCEDRFAKPEERFLVRESITQQQPGAKGVVVVIDGSAALAETRHWIVDALKRTKPDGLKILLADDKARNVELIELEKHRFSGGRDNEPALREGIRMAKETGAPVVWIHGPQAVGLSQPEALLQLLERGTTRPVIHEIEAVSGPNRLAESIYRSGCLHRGPSLPKPAEDLARFLDDLRMSREKPAWHWKRSASPDALAGKKVWDQLARLWAASTAEDPMAQLNDTQRSELAARYQLVTPFSGAVVLETQQQYEEHGLTPADGDATPQIPSVPEPSSSLLVVLTAAAALMRRRRAA